MCIVAPDRASLLGRPRPPAHEVLTRTVLARLPLALLLATLVATTAAAHEADVPSRDALVEELRSMGMVLRRARQRLDADVSLDRYDVVARLNQAQVWTATEEHPKAALRLLQLLARPGFERSLAYPDALEVLAEAEWAIGLQAAARRHLRTALTPPEQAATHWRRRFARYLSRVTQRPDLPDLRGLWVTYQRLGPAEPPDDADRAIRYGYAKALFHAKAMGEARGLFQAVPEGDPYRLRALYFLGVIDVAEGEWVKASETFEAALAAHEAAAPRPRTDADTLDFDPADPPPRLVDLSAEAEDDEGRGPLAVDEAVDRQRRVGALIHLALGRLAAARGEWDAAWQHYRKVPRGGPEFTAALSEGSFVLARREAFEWCARLIDQLLAGRGADVSAAQLTLWKLQLTARSERYEDARTGYEAFEREVLQRLEGFDAATVGDRLFPAEVLAWTAPGEATRVRTLEAELVVQREALIEAGELLAELDTLNRSKDLLPVVVFGKETHARLTAQTDRYAAKLVRAAEAAHRDGARGAHGGGAPASAQDVGRLQESLARLRERLQVFQGRLGEYEQRYRARLREVLDAERPVIAELQQALATEEASARDLAGTLKGEAKANLARYAAEARFGQVDIAFWRKEAVSRQIRRLHEDRAREIAPLDEVERELPDVAPPPPPPPPIADPPADEPADDGDEASQPVAHRD